MLEPEDFRELRPGFEEIRRLLNAAYMSGSASAEDVSDAACGHYTLALARMEELIEEVTKEEGHGIRDVLRRMNDAVKPAERAGGLGALGGAALAASKTGLGGWGVVAGGGAFGIPGLGGAAVATGGVALAGAAGFYLAYKGVAVALETDLGRNVADRSKAVGRWAKERFGKGS